MGARVVDPSEEHDFRPLQAPIYNSLCIMAQFAIRDELPAEPSLADRAHHPFAHLVDGVLIADVAASRNLIDTAMEVLRAELVAGDMEAAVD